MPTTTDKPKVDKRTKAYREAHPKPAFSDAPEVPVNSLEYLRQLAKNANREVNVTEDSLCYNGAWRSFLATAPMPAIRIAVCQAAAYKGKARFTAMPMDEWDGSDFFSVSRFDDKMVVSHFVNYSQMAAATECVNRSKEQIGNSERIIRREEGFLEFETDPSLVKQRNQFVADARAASEQAFKAKEEAEVLLSTGTVHTWDFRFEECV